jgi:hypothetical protein
MNPKPDTNERVNTRTWTGAETFASIEEIQTTIAKPRSWVTRKLVNRSFNFRALTHPKAIT